MSEFLSDEWLADLAESASAIPPLDTTITFSLEQRVVGDPTRSWTVRYESGRVRLVIDDADEADTRLITDHTTASAIHRGEMSAQRAFLDGRLQIGGDTRALVENRAALEALAPLLSATGANNNDVSS